MAATAAEDDPEVFIYSLHIDKQTDLVLGDQTLSAARCPCVGTRTWRSTHFAEQGRHRCQRLRAERPWCARRQRSDDRDAAAWT